MGDVPFVELPIPGGILPGDTPTFPRLPEIRFPGFPRRRPEVPRVPLPDERGEDIPYPEDADRILRDLADAVNATEVPEKLDYIKKMLGDFDKVDRIADIWSNDATLNDAKRDVDEARQELASYWQGRAFDAFSTHAATVSTAHGTNQTVIQGLGNSLSQCVTAIYEAYKAAIKVVVDTAADAVATGLVGVFATDSSASKIIELLTNFVKSIGGLLNGVIGTLRGLKAQGVYLTGLATQFQELPASPQQSSAPGLWHVKPADS